MNQLPWSQWHPTKNRELNLALLTYGSNKMAWWICELGHEWQTKINLRTVSGTGCPYCAGQKVAKGFNDLETTFPAVASQWHPHKNGFVTPDQISAGTEKKYWWVCELGHEWEAPPANRTRLGSGCAVCDGKKVLSGFNDLASQYPLLASEWSNKNELSSDQVVSGSGKRYWWRCQIGHEWEQTPSVRLHQGAGCPICSNQKILPGYNDLQTLEPEISLQWHPAKNGELSPSLVSAGSDKKQWWLCSKGHEWEATINSRRKNGCPVCVNKLVIQGVNDLSTTHPEIAAEWHPSKNGELLPSRVALGQIRSVWWACSEGHEWKTSLDTRNRSGCPKCAKYGFSQHGESELYFIENEKLLSWKIGITGIDRKYDRLENFGKLGWSIVSRIQAPGRIVMRAEQALFDWIRKDLKLPQHLDQASMGKHGGATETFSMIDGMKKQIVQRMKLEIKKATEAEQQTI